MGQKSCAPDKGAEDELPVTNTDLAEKEKKEAEGQQDPKLLSMLNAYQKEVETLREQNTKLKEDNATLAENEPAAKASSEKVDSLSKDKEALEKDKEVLEHDKEALQQDKDKLQEELERMKIVVKEREEEIKAKNQTIEQESKRISVLKLQSTLRQQQAKMFRDAHNSRTLIEGNLQKFSKAGKGKPKEKMVTVTHRLGEKTENGFIEGQLTLVWAENEKSTELSRAHITKLIDGADNVKSAEYDGRKFSLETQPNSKIIAFAADDQKEKERWFQTIDTAMEQIADEKDAMNSTYTFELEFKDRPLGFRVEEQFIEVADGKEDEVLVVAKIQPSHEHLRDQGLTEGLIVSKCNDVDFTNMNYTEKLEIIKKVQFPIRLTFHGHGFLQKQSIDHGIAPIGHSREVTMSQLYPGVEESTSYLQEQLELSNEEARQNLMEHPLVKKNPEIKVWLERPDFKELITELMNDPKKFKEFLMSKEV